LKFIAVILLYHRMKNSVRSCKLGMLIFLSGYSMNTMGLSAFSETGHNKRHLRYLNIPEDWFTFMYQPLYAL